LKGKRSSWLGLAALAALMVLSTGFFGPVAHAQVVSPPPHPNLPPPAPLAGVKYNYPWEIYGGIGYAATDAGPNVLQQALLGGFDARAVREFSQRWGVGANVRGYFGTTGVGATVAGQGAGQPGSIHGPFIAEYFLLGGPEYRALYDKHAALMLHTFVGGVYGDFQHDLNGVPPADVGLFSNQMALGMALGGSIDLNRSPRLVFRIAPDALMSDFGGNGLAEHMSISLGIVYRMGHQFRVK